MSPVAAPIGPWFDPASHTYGYGARTLPGVTRILGELGLRDPALDRNWPALEVGRVRGVEVHTGLHYYREDDLDLDTVPPEYRGYLECGIAYLQQSGFAPVATEVWYVSPERGYGGKIDALDRDRDGRLVLTDWKTGEPHQVSTSLQLAAYEYLIRKVFLPLFLPTYSGPILRQSVKLYADGAPARVETYGDARDLQVFFAALSVWHFRNNRLRHPGAA